ncbi:MAG: prolyl oligopeptidase family serine peptidase [Kiritimatiellia bacterium]
MKTKRILFGGVVAFAACLAAKDVTPALEAGEVATAKLQAAIDATSAAGGGTVVVPVGTWVTGGLALKDNVTLRVPKGATLLGATNRVDYTVGGALFTTRDAANVAIEGEGTIDGRGDFFPFTANGKRYRPHLIDFFNCRNVRVEGLTLRQAGTWMLHPRKCDGVTIRGLRMFNHANQCGDGIDISSRNVLVENCEIDADDDAIVFKTMEPDIVVENVEVRNCRLASICNFIKFGTETHGVTRNVNVHDCELVPPMASAVLDWTKNTPGCTNRLTGLAGLAFECVDGGRLENVTVRNVRGCGMHTPIFVRLGRRNEAKRGNESVLRDVLVENYEALAESRIACSITGVPGLRPRGITLRNVTLIQQGGGSAMDLLKEVPEKEKAYPECHMFNRQALPAYGFYIRYADDVRFENVRLDYAAKTEVRPAFHLDDASNITWDAACSFKAPSDGSARIVRMTEELRAANARAYREALVRPDGFFACPPAWGDRKPPLLVCLGMARKEAPMPVEQLETLTARRLAVMMPYATDVGGVLDMLAQVRGRVDSACVYLRGEGPAAKLALDVLAARPEAFAGASVVSLATPADANLARVTGARVELVAGLRDPNLRATLEAWNALAPAAVQFTPDEVEGLLKMKRLLPGMKPAPYLAGYNDCGRPARLVREAEGMRLILTDTGRVGVFLPTVDRLLGLPSAPPVALGAALPADADVTLTAKGEVVAARGGRVSNVVVGKADDGNLSISFAFAPERADGTLNLTVKGLYPRNWVVQSDGWTLGKWLDEQFARGIRLAHARAGVYTISKKFGATRPKDWDDLWAKLFVRVRSSLDGTLQPCYFWAPDAARTQEVPLVVGLHTWSGDYRQVEHYRTVLDYARWKGWAMVGPNFRGPNSTPPACGGEPAVQDIVDAIDYAKAQVKIDPKRVYIVGGSGGGHMTLLMLGRHPEIFAGAAAFCPITDLARWHADSLLKHPGRVARYAAMMEGACGGTPAEKPEEYRRRSPLTWLARAKAAGVPTYIVTGIHDGWTGSVPVGHAMRGFNALADAADVFSEADIGAIEETRLVPAALAYAGARDPFYGERNRIHVRRTSANVRFTLMEGGHGGNYAAALDFLSRQIKGRPADFTLPATGKGGEEALGK